MMADGGDCRRGADHIVESSFFVVATDFGNVYCLSRIAIAHRGLIEIAFVVAGNLNAWWQQEMELMSSIVG